MKNLFRFLLFLVFLGNYAQVMVLYFYPYIKMVNSCDTTEQLTGLIVLLIPTVVFIWVFKKVMGFVSHLIFREV